MAHRFLLWVVAGALTVWISLAMVVAPAVAFGAPDSGSDTTGAASDPAAPAKPTKQHKPAMAHTEKKAVGAHKDKVEDQPSTMPLPSCSPVTGRR